MNSIHLVVLTVDEIHTASETKQGSHQIGLNKSEESRADFREPTFAVDFGSKSSALS